MAVTPVLVHARTLPPEAQCLAACAGPTTDLAADLSRGAEPLADAPNRTNGTDARAKALADLAEDMADLLRFVERDTKVSPDVREEMLKCFPEIGEDTPLGRYSRKLMNHCLSHARVDKDTGGKIIPCQLLARFDGVEWSSNYNAGKRLAEFAEVFRDRLGITITEWSYHDGQARTILLEWPSPVIRALSEQEFYVNSTADIDKARKRQMVGFLTGNVVGPRSRQREKQAADARRKAVEIALAPGSMQAVVIPILHRHLSQQGTTIRKALSVGLPRLTQWLFEVYLHSPLQTTRHGKKIDTAGQTFYRAWLKSLTDSLNHEDATDFYYHATASSVRVQEVGAIPPRFPRDGRKALLGHTTLLDLKNSQFAIAAARWEARKAMEILESAESIWTYFLHELGLPPEAKPALKTAVYALCFGMRSARLQSELTWELTDSGLFPRRRAREVAKRFLGLDVMQDLLRAREGQLEAIRQAGGVRLPDWTWQGETRTGEWLPLTGPEGRDPGDYEHDVRSLLSQVMQAEELNLMLAGLEVIERTPDVTILLWQHDGVSLAFRDEGKREKQTRAIVNSVNRRCLDRGIPTRLERDN